MYFTMTWVQRVSKVQYFCSHGHFFLIAHWLFQYLVWMRSSGIDRLKRILRYIGGYCSYNKNGWLQTFRKKKNLNTLYKYYVQIKTWNMLFSSWMFPFRPRTNLLSEIKVSIYNRQRTVKRLDCCSELHDLKRTFSLNVCEMLHI